MSISLASLSQHNFTSHMSRLSLTVLLVLTSSGCSMLSSDAESQASEQAATTQAATTQATEATAKNSNQQLIEELFVERDFSSQQSSAQSFNDTSNMVRNLLGVVWEQLTNDSDPTQLQITPEQAQGLPFAAMKVYLEPNATRSEPLLAPFARIDMQLNGKVIATEFWTSGGNEVIQTEQGAITSISGVDLPGFESWYLAHQTARLQALSCYAQQAVNNNRMACPQTASFSMVQRVNSPFYSPYNTQQGNYTEQVETVQVNYQLQSARTSVQLLSGEQVQLAQILEIDTQRGTQNEFWVNVTQLPALPAGSMVKTRQYLGSQLGYMQTELLKPLNQAPAAKPQVFADVTATLAANPETTFAKQPNFVEVRVQTSTDKTWAAIFQGELRLQQLLNMIPASADGAWAPALVRLHSSKLDAEFAAKKAGMSRQLQLLEQTYQANGESDLAAQVRTLRQQFELWPLRATYIHGFESGAALRDLSQNPLLNLADMRLSQDNPAANYYSVSLATPTTPVQAQYVGLPAEQYQSTMLWVVNSKGVISYIANREQVNSSRADERALAQQAYAVVLRSIDNNDLPDGFKDVNYRLAQFLQHWDYRTYYAMQAGSQP